jgi:hypothetical protein
MFGFNTPGLAPFCHSREGGNLNIDSGYSVKAEFRNDASGDTPLLAVGLFIEIIKRINQCWKIYPFFIANLLIFKLNC